MNSHDHTHSDGCSNCSVPSTPYTQSLQELDFERSLHAAAVKGDIYLAKKRISSLIQQQKSSNSSPGIHDASPWLTLDASGYTPLHYAARHGHLEMCRFLLNLETQSVSTAGMNSKNSALCIQTPETKATPLHRACFTGNVDVMMLLIRAGAPLDMRDCDGRTPEDIFRERFPSREVEILSIFKKS